MGNPIALFYVYNSMEAITIIKYILVALVALTPIMGLLYFSIKTAKDLSIYEPSIERKLIDDIPEQGVT